MFTSLETLPPDPILGLTALYEADPRTTKIDLGVVVYQDEAGNTSVMRAVKAAEQQFSALEDRKSYIAQVGVESFNAGIVELLLGAWHAALKDSRTRAVMTPAG